MKKKRSNPTTNVRIRIDLFRKLKLIAAVDNTSIKQILEKACEEYVLKATRERPKLRDPRALLAEES
jgi:hypothetical protein